MRIEQLTYVAAVTEHGSLRRASERLHISQPALSEAVTKLERELGVTLLDRRRTGARISREGLELLPHLRAVLDAVDRLRGAAGAGSASHPVRLGTVDTATSLVVVPAIARLRQAHPTLMVELVSIRQSEIDAGLLDGSLDLGLVNVLDGDDPPTGLVDVELLRGRPVVVLDAEHALAERPAVSIERLREEPFVAMREGYLMHRFAQRLFGARPPAVVHAADGAEMGKFLVAEGVGVTVLPDYSVRADPLERAGLITTRAIAGDTTDVGLVLRRRQTSATSAPVHALHAALMACSGATSIGNRAG